MWGKVDMSDIFTTDDEPVAPSKSEPELDKSVVCPDCGLRVADSGRLAYHAKTCPEKVKKESTVKVVQPERSKTKAPSSKVSQFPSATSSDPKKQLIGQRTAKWGRLIYEDVNPVIYASVKTFVGVPDEWCEGTVAQFQDAAGKVVTLWDPPLKDRLRLSEGDCNRIAKAMATFSVSPTGMMIAAWVEHNAGLIALGTAAVVSAKFGWGVAKTKAEVAQLKELMASQQQPSPSHDPASTVKEPPASAAA